MRGKKPGKKSAASQKEAPKNPPWLTIAICLALAASFAALSEGGIFASERSISAYELSVDSPQNIIFYVFNH